MNATRGIFVMALVASAPSCARPLRPADGARDRGHADLDAARELDREGVRSFRESRYADAAHYFRAAYERGGPSTELWNIARSEERLDDAKAAAQALDEYLAQVDLSPSDRAEARHEVETLRARPSILTVITSPTAALVTLDGRPMPGSTPLSVEVPAGIHSLSVHRDGYSSEKRAVEAQFGSAVILTLDLQRRGE